jgi:hypothetical protein
MGGVLSASRGGGGPPPTTASVDCVGLRLTESTLGLAVVLVGNLGSKLRAF